MISINFRNLTPIISVLLILGLLTPSFSLAAITGAYDNSGSGSSGTDGVGQQADNSTTKTDFKNSTKADDPCNIEEPIKKTDSEDCKILKSNNSSISDTIKNAETLGMAVDKVKTLEALAKGDIHTGQVVDENGDIQTISPGYRLKQNSTNGNDRSFEDLDSSSWDWTKDTSQVKTGPLGDVLENAISGNASAQKNYDDIGGTVNQDGVDANTLLRSKQTEIKNSLEILKETQDKNRAIDQHTTAGDANLTDITETIHRVDKNTEQVQKLSNAVDGLAQAQADLETSGLDPNSTNYKIAQAQIDDALNTIQNTPLPNNQSSATNEVVGTDLAVAVSNKASNTVKLVTAQSAAGDDRFNYLDPHSLITGVSDTPFGKGAGKFVRLTPAQEAAIYGSDVMDAKTKKDILIGENSSLAKRISESMQPGGKPLTEAELKEAVGIMSVCDNRAIKSSCLNSDGSVKGNVYSSFLGSDGNRPVDARKAELADQNKLSEVESDVSKFYEKINSGLTGDGFNDIQFVDKNGQLVTVSTVDDLIACPTCSHTYASGFHPPWKESSIPGTDTNIGDHQTVALFIKDSQTPEFDVMNKYKVVTALPDNVTLLKTKQQGYTPEFTAGSLGDSPNFDTGLDSTVVETTTIGNTFTMAELGITDLNSIPDIPAPLAGWGTYAGVDDVKQTLTAFANKSPEDFVVGVVAADNVGVNVFTADNKTKTEVADSVAELSKSLAGKTRNKESSVTVNGFTVAEQAQIAVTEYNLAHDRNLSVEVISEMGPYGSHRHREIDDTAKGQGCACAVDIGIADENGKFITVKGNEALYAEFSKNFTSNTGGSANYSRTYMDGNKVHVDVANINPMRTRISAAYTSYAINNEGNFGKNIRENLNIAYDYDVSAEGHKYVKNYVVTPKDDAKDNDTKVISLADRSKQDPQVVVDDQKKAPQKDKIAPKIKQYAEAAAKTTPILNAFTGTNNIALNSFIAGVSALFQLVGGQSGGGSDELQNTYDQPTYTADQSSVASPDTTDNQIFDTRNLSATTPGSTTITSIAGSYLRNLLPTSMLFDAAKTAYKNLTGSSNDETDKTNQNNLTNNEPETIPVTVTVNDQNNTVELARDDLITSIEQADAASADYNEFDGYEKLVSGQTSFLLEKNGNVTYSDGLYAPPTEDSASRSGVDTPIYVYLIKHIDENGNLISESNANTLPDKTFIDKLSDKVFGNEGLYAFEDIVNATYELIDPNDSVPRDEYNEYIIHLTDGSTRTATVPEYTNIDTIKKQFFTSGYRGNVLPIINSATKIDSAEREKQRTLAQAVIESVSGAFKKLVNVFKSDSGQSDTFADLNINQQDTKREAISIDQLFGLYIYPNAATSCPDEVGYVFDAFVRDISNPNMITIITDDRCGSGTPTDMVADAAALLQQSYGFSNLDTDALLSKSYLNSDQITYQTGITTINTNELPQPNTDQPAVNLDNTRDKDQDKPVYIPNTSNQISFEVKVLNTNGVTLKDWTKTDISISSGDQLAFRWDGSNYSQCLLFLNDNGLYSLVKRDDPRLLTGNTEDEEFDVAEYTGNYRIECGGQENGEFGVDTRQISVTIQ